MPRRLALGPYQLLARDPNFKHVAPCYQHVVQVLDHSECTKSGGTHVGCGCSILQGVLGGGRSLRRRLEVDSHQRHVTQTKNTLCFATTLEPESCATQNVQSQAAHMSGWDARDSRGGGKDRD